MVRRGQPGNQATAAATPAPAAKGFFHGTHRLVPPEETVERIRRLMPALGITRIANITGLDTVGIPTVSVYRPNSRSLAVAQGKGLTLAAAEASGLMESLEIHHAERILLPLKLATCREMRAAHPAVEAEGLVASSPSLFHQNLRLLWIEGRDLFSGEPVWLPFECVHLDCTQPPLPGAGCFVCSSNGLAAGNHPLEAICHALCELVERDAYSRFKAVGEAERDAFRLDLETVADPDCRALVRRFEAAGLAVAVWELSLGCRVPAFQCVVVERESCWRRVGASGGMGCHPDPSIALLRSLTEAAQSRLTSISGARDDLSRRREVVLRGQDVIEKVRASLEIRAPVRDFRRIEGCRLATFDEEVSWLLQQLRLLGARRAIVVDLTHPALEVPVMRVVVPGLQGIPPH